MNQIDREKRFCTTGWTILNDIHCIQNQVWAGDENMINIWSGQRRMPCWNLLTYEYSVLAIIRQMLGKCSSEIVHHRNGKSLGQGGVPGEGGRGQAKRKDKIFSGIIGLNFKRIIPGWGPDRCSWVNMTSFNKHNLDKVIIQTFIISNQPTHLATN